MSRYCEACGEPITGRKDKRFCDRLCKDGRTYRKHKELSCATCKFVAAHPCQLDVDHIDGNHSNNHPANLQTLCANCHRLKTFVQRWA